MCLGFVKNVGSFIGVRALLGITEGGLFPGIVLYLSGLYTRQEMALRMGIFYTAASLSGAFGGLLARGLSAIGPRGGLEGWRWIFIIEGLMVSSTLNTRASCVKGETKTMMSSDHTGRSGGISPASNQYNHCSLPDRGGEAIRCEEASRRHWRNYRG